MANGKKRFQKSKGLNPAVQKMITEQKITNALNDARRKGVNWGCLGYEVMTLMVLHDKFGITDKEELRRYCKEMDSLAECMTKDYASLSDFVIALNEESGFTLTDDDLVEIDPTLSGMLKDGDGGGGC